MTPRIIVNFNHPANAGIIKYLGSRWLSSRKKKKSPQIEVLSDEAPENIPDPYYQLGTHPELVERFWDEITVKLPTKCQWVINGTPTLVHPMSGIIFGFACGTHSYALRLPALKHQEALNAGAERIHQYSNGDELDLDSIGKEWVFGSWLKDETAWCLAAYEFAGEIV